MLEANAGNGANQRGTYEFVKLLARPNDSAPGLKKWAPNSFKVQPDSLFSTLIPDSVDKYQDPMSWNSNFTNSTGKKAGGLNRRGSITQRFNMAAAAEEKDWCRSNKIEPSIHVPHDTNDLFEPLKSSSKRTHNRLSDPIATVKQRLRGAAYFNGKRDYRKLFRYYDKDNSGLINLPEFVSLMRKDGRVTAAKMSKVTLHEIFALVDSDSSGEVSHQEFEAWLTAKEQITEHQGDKHIHKKAYAKKTTFDRLSSPDSKTGIARRIYEQEMENKSKPGEHLHSPVNVAQARTGMSRIVFCWTAMEHEHD